MVFGLAVGGGAIWLVVSAAGGLGDATAALGEVEAWWLVPAVVCEGLAYVLSGLRLRRLAGQEAQLTVVSATGVELVVNGLGLLTPASPAEGLAFAVSELSHRGLDRRRVALTLGFTQWFSLRIFLLVNALNLFWLLATRDFPVDSTWPLIAAPLILVTLAGTAFLATRPTTAEHFAVVIGALRFWKPRLSRADRRAAGDRFHIDAMAIIGPPRRRVLIAALSVTSMLADVACLYFVLIAAHAHVGFDVAILAVGAAAAAGLIPLLPGGIGVVEAIIPAVVHWYGPPFASALAGALVYRALGTFLPATAGVVALFALRAKRPNRSRTTNSTSR